MEESIIGATMEKLKIVCICDRAPLGVMPQP